ncbi:uncharacterized protein LOC132714746 [Ruditapes philippinarum]|uniref:uncharacterized protein LOC132714746 n=1 Tax=Ruditapes philippinarum TaxID=129788 RepID=UPI00295B563A|nr:uncharacterized protein LOC132714746 [Ruditapes philippinarum]
MVQELGASKVSSSSTFSLPEGITLPLQSLEDVEGLEKELRQQTVLNNMVNYLSLIGGKNTPDMVRRILSHVIKSRLAESYNWYGKKGKLKFGSLKIAEVICKAVQKTTPGTTTAEVEFITREWLRTAKDREGGRKNRKAATNTSSENLEN